MTSENPSSEPISFVETPREIAELMVFLIDYKEKKVNQNQRILDTGCGKGVFLEVLRDFGYKNVQGIEINLELFSECKKLFPNYDVINTNYLIWKVDGKFEIIIGNPPYAHYSSLPLITKREVERITKSKEGDIYYSFIIKSIDLLKEGGKLIYIVPYSFFFNTYANEVRKKISQNGFLDLVIDLDENRLFYKENPETIIFRFIKNSAAISPKTTILRIKKKNVPVKKIKEEALFSIKNERSSSYFEYFQREPFNHESVIWSTYPYIHLKKAIRLRDVAWVGVGLVTGYDKAFKLQNYELDHLNQNEKKAVIKLVKAANCSGYWINGYNCYFLIDDKIKNDQEFKLSYPYLYSKILPFKKEMSERYLPISKKWYNWQALRNFETLKKNIGSLKIFCPHLDRSKTNRFSITSEKLLPSGDVLTIIPKRIEPFFLLGYLNSDFFRKYYLSFGARRGQRISFTQKIMNNISIPLFNKQVEEEISRCTKKLVLSKNLHERLKIENIISGALINSQFS
ncbi:MAG: Eco57I restriction-modification methylase domain-containing protein [Candidatus Heimdallarchaeaceae archaeon]